MIEDFNIDQNRSVSNIERSAGQDPLDIMNTDGKTDIASIVNENLEKWFDSLTNSAEDYTNSSVGK